jgi:hypothetical protein
MVDQVVSRALAAARLLSVAVVGLAVVGGGALAAAPVKAAAKSKPVGKRATVELLKDATACQILHPQRCPALAEVVELGAGAVTQLLPLLKDESVPLRAAAAAALGHLDAKAAGPALMELLSRTRRRTCAWRRSARMGRVNPEGAVEALARALGAESINEKLMATVALGQTGSPGAVMPLDRLADALSPEGAVGGGAGAGRDA